MTNFEILKALESEYAMTDKFMYFLATHFREVVKRDGTIDGLPLLRWLQEEKPDQGES